MKFLFFSLFFGHAHDVLLWAVFVFFFCVGSLHLIFGFSRFYVLRLRFSLPQRKERELESADSANVSDDEAAEEDDDDDDDDDEEEEEEEREEEEEEEAEYFEDFHLPMTHQNSMSTRRSFIRKIKAAPVCVPDADRIEGIVKAGQLNRHGSIRRKIVPQPQDFAEEDAADAAADAAAADAADSSLHSDAGLAKLTSTPNGTFIDFAMADSSIGAIAASARGVDSSAVGVGVGETLAPLDDETLAKIKDCLDANRVRDLYTLGSRLQDLLTSVEIEEIISNSHRYGDVISQDVLLALSESTRHDSGHGHDSLPSSLKSSLAFKVIENSDVPAAAAAAAAATTAAPDLVDSSGSRNSFAFFLVCFSLFSFLASSSSSHFFSLFLDDGFLSLSLVVVVVAVVVAVSISVGCHRFTFFPFFLLFATLQLLTDLVRKVAVAVRFDRLFFSFLGLERSRGPLFFLRKTFY